MLLLLYVNYIYENDFFRIKNDKYSLKMKIVKYIFYSYRYLVHTTCISLVTINYNNLTRPTLIQVENNITFFSFKE